MLTKGAGTVYRMIDGLLQHRGWGMFLMENVPVLTGDLSPTYHDVLRECLNKII